MNSRFFMELARPISPIKPAVCFYGFQITSPVLHKFLLSFEIIISQPIAYTDLILLLNLPPTYNEN